MLKGYKLNDHNKVLTRTVLFFLSNNIIRSCSDNMVDRILSLHEAYTHMLSSIPRYDVLIPFACQEWSLSEEQWVSLVQYNKKEQIKKLYPFLTRNFNSAPDLKVSARQLEPERKNLS